MADNPFTQGRRGFRSTERHCRKAGSSGATLTGLIGENVALRVPIPNPSSGVVTYVAIHKPSCVRAAARVPSSVRCISVLLLGLSGSALAGAAPDIPAFSTAAPGDDLPAGWQRYTLGKPDRVTRYSVVELDGRIVLKAQADASVSAVIHPLHADPRETPWLSWSWRTENRLTRADIRTKEGDDYVARVYVLFDYDVTKLPLFERAKIAAARLLYGDPIPTAGLCYVWDNRQAVGYTAWSAYTRRLRMIVAADAGSGVNHWVKEERNIVEDYRQAFGEEPPPITAVILATDTDNTREKAVTYFGDVTLNSAP